MPFPVTSLQDNYTIVRTYERGANFTPTEQATFAMMNTPLGNMRGFAGNVVRQMDSESRLSAQKTAAQITDEQGTDASAVSVAAENSDVNLSNLGNGADDRASLTEAIKGTASSLPGQVKNNFIPGGDFTKIFDSDCIPCGARISFKGDLDFKAGLEGFGEQILALIERQLRNCLEQIRQLIDTFKNLDRYVDLCSFLKFMSDFVCVPDLQAMLSALMAFMGRFNFQVNGIFDLIIQLVGPLLQPFLSNVVQLLQKYLLMVVKPIDCIIDKMQEVMAKMDYNVLFQNFNMLDSGISWKEGVDKQKYTPEATFNGSQIGVPFTDRTLTSGPLTVTADDSFLTSFPLPKTYNSPQDYKTRKYEANLLGWTGIAERKAAEEMAVQNAEEEIALLNKASLTIDNSDPYQTQRHREKVAEARKVYEEAVKERDMSEIGQMSQKLEGFQQGMRSIMNDIMKFIREAVAEITSFIGQFMDEWKKFIGSYFGGTGNLTLALSQKMQLVQFIALIRAMIAVFQGEVTCDYRGESELSAAVFSIMPTGADMTISISEDGSIRIDEDVANVGNAVDSVAAALGALERDDDTLVDGLDAGAKLKSLINFTGDPLLDSDISDTINKVVLPVSAVFRCPLQTLEVDAEQVNKWVEELSTE